MLVVVTAPAARAALVTLPIPIVGVGYAPAKSPPAAPLGGHVYVALMAGFGYVPVRSPPAAPLGGNAVGAPVTLVQATLVIFASVTPFGESAIYVVVTCPGDNEAGGEAFQVMLCPSASMDRTMLACGAP